MTTREVPTPLVTWLALSLAAVLGVSAVHLAVKSAHGVLTVLGISEAVGAALLLLPKLRRAGAIVLAVVLVAAACLHAATGELPPASFLVYFPALALVAAVRRSC